MIDFVHYLNRIDSYQTTVVYLLGESMPFLFYFFKNNRFMIESLRY